MIDWLDIHALRVPLDRDYRSLGTSAFYPTKDRYAPLGLFMVFLVREILSLESLPTDVEIAAVNALSAGSETVDLLWLCKKRSLQCYKTQKSALPV